MGRRASPRKGNERDAEFRAPRLDPLGGAPTLALRAALLADPLLRPIALLLDRPPRCARVLAHLSRTLGLRAAFLRDRFRSKTGLDAVPVLRAAQFRRAALRLRDSGDKIHAIAVAEGFSDATAFGRAFHRATGQSPSEYQGWARDTMRRDILAGRTPRAIAPGSGGASL